MDQELLWLAWLAGLAELAGWKTSSFSGTPDGAFFCWVDSMALVLWSATVARVRTTLLYVCTVDASRFDGYLSKLRFQPAQGFEKTLIMMPNFGIAGSRQGRMLRSRYSVSKQEERSCNLQVTGNYCPLSLALQSKQTG